MGLPCGSAGKESTCNSGDLGSISGLGKSPGEGKGYPLQYSGLENSMGGISSWGHQESDTTEQLSLSLFVNNVFSLWNLLDHPFSPIFVFNLTMMRLTCIIFSLFDGLLQSENLSLDLRNFLTFIIFFSPPYWSSSKKRMQFIFVKYT